MLPRNWDIETSRDFIGLKRFCWIRVSPLELPQHCRCLIWICSENGPLHLLGYRSFAAKKVVKRWIKSTDRAGVSGESEMPKLPPLVHLSAGDKCRIFHNLKVDCSPIFRRFGTLCALLPSTGTLRQGAFLMGNKHSTIAFIPRQQPTAPSASNYSFICNLQKLVDYLAAYRKVLGSQKVS